MNKYVFKPYSKSFPKLFDKEKARILSHVNIPLLLEHVGSTAVPDLGGKGIIDIAIAVNKQEMDSVSKQLQALGYEFRPNWSTPDRLYFITYLPDSEEGNRRYHIHLTYPENSEWKEFIGFRDYLRSHPKELQEYAKMKQQAALEANDQGERYRELKGPMFKKINSLINNTKEITIRELQKEDITALIKTFCFPWSSIEATTDKWKQYLKEHLKQIRTVFLLEKQGNILGYASLLRQSNYPSFKENGIPEIHDVWISPEDRGNGFGKRLVQHLEKVAHQENYKQVGIGVGLYRDYGRAQKLYTHLGYVPDGLGVTYKYLPVVPGDSYPVDDDLVIWLKKDLP